MPQATEKGRERGGPLLRRKPLQTTSRSKQGLQAGQLKQDYSRRNWLLWKVCKVCGSVQSQSQKGVMFSAGAWQKYVSEILPPPLTHSGRIAWSRIWPLAMCRNVRLASTIQLVSLSHHAVARYHTPFRLVHHPLRAQVPPRFHLAHHHFMTIRASYVQNLVD